jgi:hypothetical protein
MVTIPLNKNHDEFPSGNDENNYLPIDQQTPLIGD